MGVERVDVRGHSLQAGLAAGIQLDMEAEFRSACLPAALQETRNKILVAG